MPRKAIHINIKIQGISGIYRDEIKLEIVIISHPRHPKLQLTKTEFSVTKTDLEKKTSGLVFFQLILNHIHPNDVPLK